VARKLGERAVPALCARLAESKNPNARVQVVSALGRIGGTAALQAVIGALSDSHEWVRREAAVAIAELKDPRAVPALAAIVANPKSDLRDVAATALMKIGKAGAPALRALFADKTRSRWQLAEYLGRLGDLEAADLLAEAAGEKDELLQKESALALGRLRDPRAVGPLIRVCAGGWYAVEAVVLMVETLQVAAAGVASAELEAAAKLSAEQTITEEAQGFGSDQISGSSSVDCSKVHALARTELARRAGK
jgi:HEAT repeat protein